MKTTTIKLTLFAGALALGLLPACTAGGNDPGVEYAPDMYVSKGYEPMTQLEEKEFHIITKDGRKISLSKDNKTMREPVKGTIKRDIGFDEGTSAINNALAMQYPYGKNDGYEDAKKNLKNPLPINEHNLAEGRRLYNIYCTPCHGAQGLGDGKVAAKFPPNNIPSYKSDRIKNLPEGGMYHSITWGINLMGSYAYALTPEQRWQVIHYVNYLKNN